MKYLIVVLLFVNILYANVSDYFGKYLFDNGRYTKTVELESNGYGKWTYNNSKSSRYDYDEKIMWRYEQADGHIVIELLTQSADGRIQKNGQIFYLLIQKDGLLPKGSTELFQKTN